jgi:cytochrome c-type biogenesis protein CcmH/NrfG
MNETINQELLKEVRKLSRINQRVFWLVLLLVIIGVLWIPLRRRQAPGEADSWDKVGAAMRRADSKAALSLAQVLAARQPGDYYGHAYLGAIYLAMNDLTNSEAQYLLAYELFPSEENEKALAAVRKRLAAAPPGRPLLR